MLRTEVRKHEKFQEEMKQLSNCSSFGPRRKICELDTEFNDDAEEDIELLSSSVIKCWNCDGVGHRYHDCLKPRRIFCYGCGKVDTYKPNCSICQEKGRSLNFLKDVYPPPGAHPQKK